MFLVDESFFSSSCPHSYISVFKCKNYTSLDAVLVMLSVIVISSRFLECERCLFVADLEQQSSASRSKEQLPSPSGTNL